MVCVVASCLIILMAPTPRAPNPDRPDGRPAAPTISQHYTARSADGTVRWRCHLPLPGPHWCRQIGTLLVTVRQVEV